ITSLSPAGVEMPAEHWDDQSALCFGMLLDGRAQTSGIRQRGHDATILLVFNAYHDVLNFVLPGEEGADARWLLLIDTNNPQDLAERGKVNFTTGDEYAVTRRSMHVFRLATGSGAAIGR